MASSRLLLLFAVQLLVLVAVVSGTRWQDFLRLSSESASDDDDAAAVGTRWAVLIAGSNGYYNYRHQVKLLSITASMDDDMACLIWCFLFLLHCPRPVLIGFIPTLLEYLFGLLFLSKQRTMIMACFANCDIYKQEESISNWA